MGLLGHEARIRNTLPIEDARYDPGRTLRSF